MPDTGSKTISPSTIVSFSCFDGLTLNGIETVVCNNDGTWSNRLPTCEKKGIVEMFSSSNFVIYIYNVVDPIEQNICVKDAIVKMCYTDA